MNDSQIMLGVSPHNTAVHNFIIYLISIQTFLLTVPSMSMCVHGLRFIFIFLYISYIRFEVSKLKYKK